MIGPGLSPRTVAALRASDRRIVITGASGWLGTATLELLHDALGDDFARRVVCFGSNARLLSPGADFAIEQQPVTEIRGLSSAPTMVLHFAFLTKDKANGMTTDAYAQANAGLSALVLEALERIGATSVFVASSGAALAADDATAAPDMRLYGALKLRDEQSFAQWAKAHGKCAVITRIFNVAGPHINKHHAYAMAAFINDGICGRPITVRAPHRVERGYVAIRELMSLVFLLLVEEAAGVEAFDTGGDPMELVQVAQAVGEWFGVAVERAPITSERSDRYFGDRFPYERLLAKYGVLPVSLLDQIRETANSMIAAGECSG